MTDTLPRLVRISEAASFLGVSIDTIRRWDSQGIIHSQRPNGKDRFFELSELEKIKTQKPLTRPEAAKILNVSVSTLRRLEKKGAISYKKQGNRPLYEKKALESFLNNEPVRIQQDANNSFVKNHESKEENKQNEEKIDSTTSNHKIHSSVATNVKNDIEIILLKPWARIPELLISCLVLLLLLGVSLRNVALEGKMPPKAAKILGVTTVSSNLPEQAENK